mmetsp:Transcript_14926/g.41533  ORF Transcript_14926/g.41533 Transcript_14926/m.41533 type:complete len:419 (-) Transcript_14926:568-1824(-)
MEGVGKNGSTRRRCHNYFKHCLVLSCIALHCLVLDCLASRARGKPLALPIGLGVIRGSRRRLCCRRKCLTSLRCRRCRCRCRRRCRHPQIALDQLKGSKANCRKGPAPKDPRSGPRVEPLPSHVLDDVQHARSDTEGTAPGRHARLDDVDGCHDETGRRSGDGPRQKGPGGPEAVVPGVVPGVDSGARHPLALEFLVQHKANRRRRNVPQQGRPVPGVQSGESLLADDAANRAKAADAVGCTDLELLLDDLLGHKHKGGQDVAAGGRQAVDHEPRAVAVLARFALCRVSRDPPVERHLGGLVGTKVQSRRGDRSQCRRTNAPVDPLEGVLGAEHRPEGVLHGPVDLGIGLTERLGRVDGIEDGASGGSGQSPRKGDPQVVGEGLQGWGNESGGGGCCSGAGLPEGAIAGFHRSRSRSR